MNAIQKRITELHNYQPQLEKPADFDAYWAQVKQEALNVHYNVMRKETPTYMQGVTSYEIVYEGYANTMIHATLSIPASGQHFDQAYPCIISIPGYQCERSNSYQHAQWLLMGLAVLSVDVRGQGRETGNLLGSSHAISRGWITEGILDKDRCYYKAVAIDLLRALSWLKSQPEIDASRIGASGASQGGGLASLLTALDDGIGMLVADVPNMCHIDYGVLHSTGSLAEVAQFCKTMPEQLPHVLHQLSYFDLMHWADSIQVPVLMSVCLKDTICLPEQIFPFYNRIPGSQKQLEIYPFSGHVVEVAQQQKTIEFVYEQLLNKRM